MDRRVTAPRCLLIRVLVDDLASSSIQPIVRLRRRLAHDQPSWDFIRAYTSSATGTHVSYQSFPGWICSQAFLSPPTHSARTESPSAKTAKVRTTHVRPSFSVTLVRVSDMSGYCELCWILWRT